MRYKILYNFLVIRIKIKLRCTKISTWANTVHMAHTAKVTLGVTAEGLLLLSSSLSVMVLVTVGVVITQTIYDRTIKVMSSLFDATDQFRSGLSKFYKSFQNKRFLE